MKGRVGSTLGERPPEVESEQADDRVVSEVSNSPLFQKSPVLRELLLYLWQHRDEELSEYAIGVDVLGRRPDFNPKNDATVRAQVSRLRTRLREYYDGDGKSSPSRVLIPTGAHRITILEAPRAHQEPLPPPVIEPARSRTGPLFTALAVIVVLLASDDIRLRFQPIHAKAISVPEFWRPLVDAHNPVNLIVPTPVFLHWQGVPFVARDFRVNNIDAVPDSPYLKGLIEKFGPPELSQLYTVASDTIATSHMIKFLQDHGVGARIVDAPAITLDVLESANAVVLVGSGSVDQLDDSLRETNFRFGIEPGKGGVINQHPAPGEPARWNTVQYAPFRFTAYGVVAVLPGRGSRNTLLLASDHNQNLSEVLTNTSELQKIEKMRKAHGSPKYFEYVVRMETNGDNTLKSTPVAFRAVTPK